MSETYGLAGVSDCGCVTAALSLRFATQKDIEKFYAEMAKTGREVRKLPREEISSRLFECEHDASRGTR